MHIQTLKLTQIRYLNYERGVTLKQMDSQFIEGCRYYSITKPNELCPAWIWIWICCIVILLW